jgi:hypothetical protein
MVFAFDHRCIRFSYSWGLVMEPVFCLDCSLLLADLLTILAAK